MIGTDEHHAWLLEQGRNVEMPDDLRAEHQPDPQRLAQDTQCVCMCGAYCQSYEGHLVDVVQHREDWDRMCAERGDPAEAFAKAGIDFNDAPAGMNKDHLVADALLGAEEILEVLSNRGTRGVEQECNAARIFDVLETVRAAKRNLS